MDQSTSRPGRIQALLLAGRTYSEIIAEVGCAKSTVAFHAARLGRSQPPPVYGWPSIQQFYDQGHTRSECLAHFSCGSRAWAGAVRRGELILRRGQIYPPRVRSVSSKAVGERTEAMVLAALLQVKDSVLLPFGDNQRYDMVFEERGSFYRVQCKTGRLKSGGVHFITCSSYAHRGRAARSYQGEIDFFGVYCPQNAKVYLVPVGDVGSRAAVLRITPSRTHRTRMADQYEVAVLAA